ncbi:MAG: hypothetical protein Tsb0021_12470 [Chlamydiales bacterium]
MKFAITQEHRHRFFENGSIEFENLISSSFLDELDMSLTTLFREIKDSKNIYFQGRDTWRKNSQLQKLVLSKHLAAIAADLTGSKILKIGYDQYFPQNFTSNSTVDYPLSITSISSLTPLVCGVFICLSSPTATSSSHLPTTRGCVSYILPHTVLEDTTSFNSGRYFLITYSSNDTIYQPNQQDPHPYALKHMGYIYGSRLKEKEHPTVFRML